MPHPEIALMAHLLRRSGFGATRDELERYLAKRYEATVEELLHPEDAPPAIEDEDITRRYHVDENNLLQIATCQASWVRRMVKTGRPLEEKLALFWHGVFATGNPKVDHPSAVLKQIDMYRRHGLGSFRDLLVYLSQSPPMIFWLDNKDNHRDAVNENYGRELLELFSMGVGNYTEVDVRQASRAFTGWTLLDIEHHAIRAERDSVWPYGRLGWHYEYHDYDHDREEKSFLGESGPLDGEDVIDVICRQPATARFIARHLYTFFVADEAQVPAWNDVPPRDPAAIATLMEAFVGSDYNIRSVLRVLFNSDFFKNAQFARVKSPAEFIAGTARLAGGHDMPRVSDIELSLEAGYMGQELLDPPSVEGWHTGKEWITTASLVNRINFAVQEFSDPDRPGVRSVIERVKEMGAHTSPEVLVDACLDLVGPLTVSEQTRQELVGHASLRLNRPGEEGGMNGGSAEQIREMLQLVVSTREYQWA